MAAVNPTVWTERQAGPWTDCVFSSYGMALEYAGFTAFPLGAGTAAQREAFAGPLTTGATLAQADSRSLATFGTKLQPLDTSLSKALARPGYAYVVTGNYSKLSPNSDLVKHVYGWNNYDTSNPLPSVDHAVTIITNPDGTLTWLDPTAPQGASGIPVTAAEVMQFNGGNIIDYPVRQIKQDTYAPAASVSNAASTIAAAATNTGSAITTVSSVATTDNPLSATSTWQDVYDTYLAHASSTDNKQFIQLALDGLRGNAGMNDTISNPNGIVAIVSSHPDWFSGNYNVPDLLSWADTIVKVGASLVNPANWIHIGAILAGVALIGFALYMISKDVASPDAAAPSTPSAPIVLKEGA